MGGGLRVWWHPPNEDVRDGRLSCFWGELIPVSECARKECVVSVVNAAAETLVAVLQAVVASPSLPCPSLPLVSCQDTSHILVQWIDLVEFSEPGASTSVF